MHHLLQIIGIKTTVKDLALCMANGSVHLFPRTVNAPLQNLTVL